jgi:hypothetical protein
VTVRERTIGIGRLIKGIAETSPGTIGH